MGVKLGRIIFKKVGGVVIPVRNNAKRIGSKKERILPPLAKPESIGQHFHVKQNFKDAAFWLQRKGSEKTVGKVRSGFPKEDLGIKAKDPTKILDDFAKYAFMNLHNQGFWKNKAFGSLALKNLRASEVKKSSIEDLFPSMKKQRAELEAASWGERLATSKRNLMKIQKELKKGGKLKDKSADEMRLVRGIDRKVNARAKGVRFIKKNGRVIPIRVKK